MRSLAVGPLQNNDKEKHPICRNFCYCFSLNTGGLVLGILHIIIAILISSGSLYVVIYFFHKNYDFYDFMDVNNELIPRLYAYIAIFTSIASFSLIDIIFGFVIIIGVIQVWLTEGLAGLYFEGAFKKVESDFTESNFFCEVLTLESGLCVVTKVLGDDYCNPKLCKAKGPHVACKNPGKFSLFCPRDRTSVDLSVGDKETILDSHNSFRNIIASGSIGSFCSASRMSTMQWSDELENLAKLNVLQCKMKVDSCRNTLEFTKVGQNLALQQQTGSFMATTTALIKTIQSWFYEYREANQSIVDSCCGKNLLNYEHFLQMVNDRATHVGCAIARYSDTTKNVLIACNYASGNTYRHKIYKCGKSASECFRGTNPRYKALCNVNEPIDANQMY